MVSWPDERENAEQLVAAGVPILYLVRADDDPPAPTGCLEDWVRVPGDERDLLARLAALELRGELHAAPPYVDNSGRLHHRGNVVPLNETDARIARTLTMHLGDVVSDRELLDTLHNTETRPPVSLRTEISRLRTRLRHLQLTITRSRGHGYVMVLSPPGRHHASST